MAHADAVWGDSICIGVRHADDSQVWLGHTRHFPDTIQEPHVGNPDFTRIGGLPDITLCDGIQEPNGNILMLCAAGLARWRQTDGMSWITRDPQLFSGAMRPLLRLDQDTVVWIVAN